MMNENMNAKIRMNSKGQVIINESEWTKHAWSASELIKVRQIRKGAQEAVRTVLEEYNPLVGLPDLEKPKKREASELIRFARFANPEMSSEEIEKICEEAERTYAKEFDEYKHELQRRRFLLDDYSRTLQYGLDSIGIGDYRDALKHARKLKGAFKNEVCAVIIRAMAEEAPYASRAAERHRRIDTTIAAKQKIKEGVATLLKNF